MPVVGLDALKYFWTKRTPEEASRDLQQIIESGLARYGKSRVVLDPALMLAIDVFPCEDGHTQERALLDPVLATVAANDCGYRVETMRPVACIRTA